MKAKFFSLPTFSSAAGAAAWLGRVGLGLVLLVSFVVGMLYVFQDHLLYFPKEKPLAEVAAEARKAGVKLWPSEGDYRGLLWEPSGPVRGTALVFHGTGELAADRVWLAEALGRFGLRVVLTEYPGYGPRGGALGEASLVADGRQSLALVQRQFSGPVYVVGESLGSGVAAEVAGHSNGVSGVLLVLPWDELEHVAGYHYPLLPVSMLLRDRYNSVANLAAFPGSVAVVVAGDDRIVPTRFGKALFDSLPGRKKLWTVAGFGHTDWFKGVDGAWWAPVVDFVTGDKPLPG